MKRRFILYRRKLGGVFYVEDTETGALVAVTTGGGGESRVTSTVNSFFKDSSFRPPSGVPVMPK